METIVCKFKSNGKTIRKTAILNDALNTLSNSQKNEAFDIFDEDYGEGYWSIFFEEKPGTIYEIELVFNLENRQKTLKPIKAITWENDVINDVQEVTISSSMNNGRTWNNKKAL